MKYVTDCITIFLNVVAKGGTIRWNWHITLICAWPPRGCTIDIPRAQAILHTL
jgi:hypothetical protein